MVPIQHFYVYGCCIRITNPDGGVHEVHEVQRSRISISIWNVHEPRRGILGADRQVLLHCIRTLRTVFERFELVSRHIQIPFKGISSVTQYLILFEYGSNPVRNTSVHKLRQECSRGSRGSRAPSGAFNIHETFTSPDGGVVKTNRQVLLHCIRTVRIHFYKHFLNTYSNKLNSWT